MYVKATKMSPDVIAGGTNKHILLKQLGSNYT